MDMCIEYVIRIVKRQYYSTLIRRGTASYHPRALLLCLNCTLKLFDDVFHTLRPLMHLRSAAWV